MQYYFLCFPVYFPSCRCVSGAVTAPPRTKNHRAVAPANTSHTPNTPKTLLHRTHQQTPLRANARVSNFNHSPPLIFYFLLFTFLFSSRRGLARRLRSCKLGSIRVVGPALYQNGGPTTEMRRSRMIGRRTAEGSMYSL